MEAHTGEEESNSQKKELSDSKLSLDDVTAVVDNKEMWARFDAVVRRVRSGEEEVPGKDLKCAMAAVYMGLLYTNYSRPGAISNCTVDNYVA